MKKLIIMAVFFVTCLTLVTAGSAQAAEYTGTAAMSAPGYASIVVNISSNVFMAYEGNSNGQTYGAYTKNKAGDKYYATGGGGGASTGIYFKQSDGYVGNTGFSDAGVNTLFVGTGWTAQ
jgi:hypothetical protein